MAFENGAVGTIEATRFATGRKNSFRWEVNGSRGSIAFDLERLNELQVHFADTSPGGLAQGFRTVLVSEPDHPFWEHWWPQGHVIGWEHTFVHELHHLLTAIRDDSDVAPHGATLEDGYRAAEVCDAMLALGRAGHARDGQLPLMSPTVLLIGTLDTKGAEYAYLRERLELAGVDVLLADVGTLEPARGAEPDIAREDVARETGADVAAPGGGARPGRRDRGDGGGRRRARAPPARRGPHRRRPRRGRLGQHGDRHAGHAGAAGGRAEARWCPRSRRATPSTTWAART